ncbi:MAG: glycoside hydrolase family 108 protein [Acetobacteraceae bacterium]
MAAFDRAFDIVVLGTEKGYQNDPDDPGNWTGGAVNQGRLRGTNFGISAASYPTLDIAQLTEADARAIYRRDYWDHVQGDALPAPLALLVFDAAVNNGTGQAARWLQRAVGVEADGQIGPETLAAVQRQGTIPDGGWHLCAGFMALRMQFMAGLPTWRSFGAGWSLRLARLPWQAMTMAQA